MISVLHIARRYAFSKSKTKTINIITMISALGIIASSMALFVVLCVFNGLEDYSKSYTFALDPSVTLFPKMGKTFDIDTATLRSLGKIDGIDAISPIVEERVIFSYDNKQLVATIKGVPSNYAEASQLADYIEGNYWIDTHSNEAVIGKSIAYELGVSALSTDKIFQALAMKPGQGISITPDEAYTQITLNPIDVYSFNNVDIDRKYVYTNLGTAQKLLSLPPHSYSKIAVFADENVNLNTLIDAIKSKFPDTFVFKTREQLNEGLYKMLQTEKIAVFLVFSLVIIITLFCLCGAIIMIILEKKEQIKTLFALGLPYNKIRSIFFYQGMILSVGGMIIGLILGTLLSYGQKEYQWIRISEQFAYPIHITFQSYWIVFFTTTALSLTACYIASSRINYLK